MGFQFARTVSASEVKSTYLNLTDDSGQKYGGELALPHKAKLLVIDNQGRQTPVKMHWSNQIWGSIKTWFQENKIQPGDIVEVAYDASERQDGLPVLHLAVQGRTDMSARAAGTELEDSMASESTAEIPFGLEKQIEDFLAVNVGLIEPGLKLFVEDGREGRQYPTTVGIIDMLCQRPNGDLVVVELKRGRASDKVVGQISRYMGWVKENVAESHAVFGLILSADADVAMRYAVAAHPNLEARYMRVKLDLTDHPPT